MNQPPGRRRAREDRHRRLRMLEMLEHIQGDDQAVARALGRVIDERARRDAVDTTGPPDRAVMRQAQTRAAVPCCSAGGSEKTDHRRNRSRMSRRRHWDQSRDRGAASGIPPARATTSVRDRAARTERRIGDPSGWWRRPARAAHRPLDEIDRPALYFFIDAADILANDPERDQNHPADDRDENGECGEPLRRSAEEQSNKCGVERKHRGEDAGRIRRARR